MDRKVYAAIDIGSNAIRLLINYIEPDGSGQVAFKKAVYMRVPVRLGEDVFTTGKVGKLKSKKLYDTMQAFALLMKTFDVDCYRACATSAMREARNHRKIVNAVEEKAGIEIDVISGREEATLIWEASGVNTLMDFDRAYLYVDVGGGSTEVVVYCNHKTVYARSFPLGTVRILSGTVDEKEQKKFTKWIAKIAKKYQPVGIIGSGGNINRVFKLLNKREKDVISYEELRDLYLQLNSMTLEERICKRGLNDDRADVIIPAMTIFLNVASVSDINQIIVPRVGLVDGIVHRLYRKAKPAIS